VALTLTGDLICFIVFGLLGLRSHEEGLTVANFARAVLPFAGAWLVAASAFGVSRPTPWNRALLPRLLAAWSVAWPAGFALRMLLFGRPFVLAFAIVSFVVPCLLLLAWRGALIYTLGRRQRNSA
jgi:hypothetical protein